jgi:hypothetical protein
MKRFFTLLGIFCLFGLPTTVHSQVSAEKISSMVAQYKLEYRGPYRDIRWFCKDGSINMPKEPCSKPGGVQHARYKEEVIALGKSNHVFLGQILSSTTNKEFWDAENHFSRLKQYQLEKFLFAADDGWIQQKSQYYRGAMQAEDEAVWGIQFFDWLLADKKNLKEQFFLIRQAARDIPHRGDDNVTLRVRATSKTLADGYSSFMNLRIKIHGQPESKDIKEVKKFRDQNKDKLSEGQLKQFESLIKDMETMFTPVQLSALSGHLKALPSESSIRKEVEAFITEFGDVAPGIIRLEASSKIILRIREEISAVEKPAGSLALLDLSLDLEDIIFKESQAIELETMLDLVRQIAALSRTAAGAGWLETWEWNKMEKELMSGSGSAVALTDLQRKLEISRAMVEWGAAMSRATWGETVDLFQTFEPLAYGFFDDKVRSSVLLPLGASVGRLGDIVAESSGRANKVFGIANQGQIRGLNPGYAKGELVVVSESPDEIEVSNNKIYLFERPPADLKPVGGIATVTEGNAVSHVQLLARNLGIPNAVLSRKNLLDLKAMNGKEVFYAVSPDGTVIMKSVAEMNEEERKLFEVKARKEERIEVPVAKLNLLQKGPVNMRNVDAKDSGKLCGPKAANLGQLKQLFPDNVVEGIVIPFGVFRDHMDQTIPGGSESYWEFLTQIFDEASVNQANGMSQKKVDEIVLQELEKLREAIKKMPLRKDFVAELKACFAEVLGRELGKIPVFLRSDTNMEDLAEFTGAGLNLTLFNVLAEEKILQGIKDVWASPYTDRSYKWRQRYLLNPENVYPSILVIPSVDCDYSGVIITKGIANDVDEDITVAFSRGVGGAVDGQSAESYLLKMDGENRLLSPAREARYRTIPTTGGSVMKYTSFEEPILSPSNIQRLRTLTADCRRRLPNTPGVESAGPFDIELGFLDEVMWLFQVRPFVENKNALSSEYLQSINGKFPEAVTIPWQKRLNPR